MGQSSSGALRRARNTDDGADDVKRQVDSDNNIQRPIYQLVNVKDGGGKLIDILKGNARGSSGSFGITKSAELAMSQQLSEDQIDQQICDLVKPLLYNEGRGKLVPLVEIWRARYGKTSDKSTGSNEVEVVLDEEVTVSESTIQTESNCRWVCWRLDERGFVGETALHICFLLSTPTHMILARKLLAMFPMLINDIYTCDQYFGESCLHMAIVNEEVRIVKLLLDHGANVRQRCLGHFFLPTDQQDSANAPLKRFLFRSAMNLSPMIKNEQLEIECPRVDSLSQLDLNSNQLNYSETNYHGYAYWGEYPLSFAACLGLVDCYKILLAKGANPNWQDSNGNTTLHMTVIANRLDMFDLCYSNGANLALLNKQNLSPLTLAAKLCRVDVNWIFCNVGFVESPLAGVDSICLSDGSCDNDSVLSIVVFGGSNEHLQMLDGLLSQLLTTKWETGAKHKFYLWLCNFLLFLAITSVAYISRFERYKHQQSLANQNQQSANRVEVENKRRSNNNLKDESSSVESNYSKHFTMNDNKQAEIDQKEANYALLMNEFSEYALLAYVIYYLWTLMASIVLERGTKFLVKSLKQAPELLLFTLTCLLILACIPLRLLGLNQLEDALAALVMLTLPLKLLFFCRASRSFGSFVVMIYKIVVNDVLCFVVFLIIFVAGFSQSFVIIFKTHKTHQNQCQQSQQQPYINQSGLAQTLGQPLVSSVVYNNHSSTRYDVVAEMNLGNINPSSNENIQLDANLVSEKNYFVNLFDGVISMHMMALNEFSAIFDEFQATDYPVLARCFFVVYMVLVSILLVNMLIAMLGKTFQDIASQPNENLRQWARALLIIERMWTCRERLEILARYSHEQPATSSLIGQTKSPYATSSSSNSTTSCSQTVTRYYSSTWPLESKDRHEIRELRVLNKQNQLNAMRLVRWSEKSSS